MSLSGGLGFLGSLRSAFVLTCDSRLSGGGIRARAEALSLSIIPAFINFLFPKRDKVRICVTAELKARIADPVRRIAL